VLALATGSIGMAYSIWPLGASVLSEALQIGDSELDDAAMLDD
jgi:hypothetical protein